MLPDLNLESWASVVTIAGLPIAIGAFFLGYRQLRLARRAASAQTLVALHESFRQAWTRVADAPDDRKEAPIRDLLNVVELGCAVVNDKVMAQRTGDVLVEFLCHQILLFEGHDATRGLIERSIQTGSTFEQLGAFMARQKVRLEDCRRMITASALQPA
jgi:hypothetical protein